jgi:hypothetical protein
VFFRFSTRFFSFGDVVLPFFLVLIRIFDHLYLFLSLYLSSVTFFDMFWDDHPAEKNGPIIKRQTLFGGVLSFLFLVYMVLFGIYVFLRYFLIYHQVGQNEVRAVKRVSKKSPCFNHHSFSITHNIRHTVHSISEKRENTASTT